MHALPQIEGAPLRCTLELILSTITTAAAALEYQNADGDADVARLLRHGAGNLLAGLLERIGDAP